MSNTDGFNFSYPMTDKLRYNDEHPYISNGAGRNSVKDKKYFLYSVDNNTVYKDVTITNTQVS